MRTAVLLDTSFLITLADPRRDRHPVAKQYFQHFLASRMPMMVSAKASSSGSEGLKLRVPAGNLPAGGRRAGLTSHWFKPRMIGQEQRVYTGWMTSAGPFTLPISSNPVATSWATAATNFAGGCQVIVTPSSSKSSPHDCNT